MTTLKRNAIVIFIDRPLDKLAGYKGRPLTPDFDAMKKKFDERYGLYKQYADVVIDNSGTAEEAVARIIEATEAI